MENELAGGLDNLGPQQVQQKELVGTELRVGSGVMCLQMAAGEC